jgi:hypothetical protein
MMNVRKNVVVCAAALMLAVSFFPAAAQGQEKVSVEAVGFFTHFPMRQTRQVIEATCAKFGDRVTLKLYDETRAEGQAFMEEKNLSGHIPMRLYINGVNTFRIDGQEIAFSDFVGYAWMPEHLEKAITLALEGGVQAIAADAPAKKSGGNPLVVVSIAAGIIAIALAGFLLFGPKKKAGAKAA